MSLLDQIEEAEELKFYQGLQHQQAMYGDDIRVFHKTTTVYDSVYGSASGETPSSFFDIKGVTAGDDFFPQDSHRKGGFDEGWLWTFCKEKITPGSLLEINPSDGKSEQYRIVEVLGSRFTSVMKYRLAAVDEK